MDSLWWDLRTRGLSEVTGAAASTPSQRGVEIFRGLDLHSSSGIYSHLLHMISVSPCIFMSMCARESVHVSVCTWACAQTGPSLSNPLLFLLLLVLSLFHLSWRGRGFFFFFSLWQLPLWLYAETLPPHSQTKVTCEDPDGALEPGGVISQHFKISLLCRSTSAGPEKQHQTMTAVREWRRRRPARWQQEAHQIFTGVHQGFYMDYITKDKDLRAAD